MKQGTRVHLWSSPTNQFPEVEAGMILRQIVEVGCSFSGNPQNAEIIIVDASSGRAGLVEEVRARYKRIFLLVLVRQGSSGAARARYVEAGANLVACMPANPVGFRSLLNRIN